MKYQSLKWINIRADGEVVSEEPGTESHLGIFHQGGVHHLGLPVFGWLRISGICGDHLHLHTEGNIEERKESW